MKSIKLLDCTLRDGGSINNGMFGYINILKICQFLNDANIEIIDELKLIFANYKIVYSNSAVYYCNHRLCYNNHRSI